MASCGVSHIGSSAYLGICHTYLSISLDVSIESNHFTYRTYKSPIGER